MRVNGFQQNTVVAHWVKDLRYVAGATAARAAYRLYYTLPGLFCGAERDSAAVAALLKTRASQRAAVVAQYLPKGEPARRVTPGLSVSGSS